jgi:protein phosphatase 1G
MGPYLSQPVKSKHTIFGEGKKHIYAGSEMQGWRKTMEDSHILKADFTNDISVFGVFDGHGGREVAYYVEKHFLEELEKNANFKALKFELALREVFLRMDEMMRTPTG